MTISTLILVLLITAAALGAVALTSAVIRGDGRFGPGRRPTPPRSHHADMFESAMRRYS